MGAAARYTPATGEKVNATVYIYGRGQARHPEGGGSPDVMQEVRATAAELNALVRMGRYRSVAFEGGMDVRATPTSGSVRCANFRVVQQDGATTGDSTCVTVQHGRFVKVRLTSWNPPELAFAGMAAAALVSAVWETQARGKRV